MIPIPLCEMGYFDHFLFLLCLSLDKHPPAALTQWTDDLLDSCSCLYSCKKRVFRICSEYSFYISVQLCFSCNHFVKVLCLSIHNSVH